MLRNILKKLGYIHDSELTEQFLGLKYGEVIGDPSAYSIETEQEKNFFNDLARVDGIAEYLKATAAKDMQRYFAAPDEKQRDIIRGAFARTIYLYTRLTKSNIDKQS